MLAPGLRAGLLAGAWTLLPGGIAVLDLESQMLFAGAVASFGRIPEPAEPGAYYPSVLESGTASGYAAGECLLQRRAR
jgi:hypothetical protein